MQLATPLPSPTSQRPLSKPYAKTKSSTPERCNRKPSAAHHLHDQPAAVQMDCDLAAFQRSGIAIPTEDAARQRERENVLLAGPLLTEILDLQLKSAARP